MRNKASLLARKLNDVGVDGFGWRGRVASNVSSRRPNELATDRALTRFVERSSERAFAWRAKMDEW